MKKQSVTNFRYSQKDSPIKGEVISFLSLTFPVLIIEITDEIAGKAPPKNHR